jgi:hypothetical protein
LVGNNRLATTCRNPHQKWWGFFIAQRFAGVAATGGNLFGEVNSLIFNSSCHAKQIFLERLLVDSRFFC